MASSVARSGQYLHISRQIPYRSNNSHATAFLLHFHRHRNYPSSPLHASRRTSNFPQGGENLADPSRNWSRSQNGMMVGFPGEYDEDGGDEDEEEDEEEDRSLDLLVKFVENVFKKVSKRARKAVRSVLPLNISSKLVGFSVNGVIILAFLWVLKAFLEVVCTLGSVVFASILLIRGIWTGLSYLQESRYRRTDDFGDEHNAWTGTQPVS